MRFWGKAKALEMTNSIFQENVTKQELESAFLRQIKDIHKVNDEANAEAEKLQRQQDQIKALEQFGAETKDYTKNLSRQKHNPSGQVVHENYAKFRSGTSIVESLVLNEEKDENAKQSQNHLLKAKIIEKK